MLPLPSENWSDFADIWFCHNHSHQTGSQSQDAGTASQASSPLTQPSHEAGSEQPKALPHRPGDCLVSTLYLLVDSSQVCRTTVGITPQTQRLVCMRCGNFVGFVKKKGDVLSAYTCMSLCVCMCVSDCHCVCVYVCVCWWWCECACVRFVVECFCCPFFLLQFLLFVSCVLRQWQQGPEISACFFLMCVVVFCFDKYLLI